MFRPRRAVQTATRNSLPPGLRVAYFSFLKLQSHCRENEALMLRNHSETESDTLWPLALGTAPYLQGRFMGVGGKTGTNGRFVHRKGKSNFASWQRRKCQLSVQESPTLGDDVLLGAPSVPGTSPVRSHLRQHLSQHALWTPLPSNLPSSSSESTQGLSPGLPSIPPLTTHPISFLIFMCRFYKW